MAQVWKNAMLIINGVALSCNTMALTLNYEAESLDESVMGVASRVRRGGLFNPNFDATFKQNFACVDATLFGLVGCQTCVEIRACNACSAAANPIYYGTFHVQSYPPMGGNVGDLLQTAVRFESAGALEHCAVTTP